MNPTDWARIWIHFADSNFLHWYPSHCRAKTICFSFNLILPFFSKWATLTLHWVLNSKTQILLPSVLVTNQHLLAPQMTTNQYLTYEIYQTKKSYEFNILSTVIVINSYHKFILWWFDGCISGHVIWTHDRFQCFNL